MMRLYEIIRTEKQLEEDWKSTVASTLAAGGLIAGAHFAGTDRNTNLDYGIEHHEKFVQADPRTKTNNPKEEVLYRTALKHGIKGNELTQFLAQCAHESQNFTKMVEVGSDNYFLRKYLKKSLGNQTKQDALTYIGRGFIQLTGKYNYMKAGEALGLPLVEKPELAANPKIAADIAVWYWKSRVQPKVNDFSDTKRVTKNINAGLNGLADRMRHYDEYKKTSS